jgi:P27 family predicted phage terminase small subunit
MPANTVPTAIKQLKGTERPSRAKAEIQPAILAEVPDPPAQLGENGQKVWIANGQWLLERGMLAATDLFALHRYCRAVEDYLFFDEVIREHGAITGLYDEDGALKWTKLSDELQARDRAAATCSQLEAKFGFTPADRTRLSPAAPKKQSKLDALKKK